MRLPLIPQDKANHVVYGAAIALVAYAVLLAIGTPHAAWFSMLVVALFAVGKEIHDRLKNRAAERAGLPPPHGVELMDTVATLAGGGLVAATALLPTWIG
jgi:hypothetical protein